MMYRWIAPYITYRNTTFVTLSNGNYQTPRKIFTVEVAGEAYYNGSPIWEKLI